MEGKAKLLEIAGIRYETHSIVYGSRGAYTYKADVNVAHKKSVAQGVGQQLQRVDLVS